MYKMHSRQVSSPQLKPLAGFFASLFALSDPALSAQLSTPAPQPFTGATATQSLRAALSQKDFTRPALRAAKPAAPSSVASAAVTSCGDDPGDFTTLRHAVLTANPGDTVELSGLQCSRITLTGGAIEIAVDDLVIHGPGASALTIDGNQADRVFKHDGIGTLTLADVTVANGVVSADKAYGGCIYSKGNLALTNATLTSCKALGQTAAAGGGALTLGSITLDSSVLSGNLADAAVGGGKGQLSAAGGGAVAVTQTADDTLNNSVVTGNTAQSPTGTVEGGGLVAFKLTAKYSTFSGNKAIGGGDQDNYGVGGGVVTLDSAFTFDCTVDHNQADLAGGMFLSNASFATIIQSTISSNTGNLAVGGIAANGDVSIGNSTIAFNTGGPLGGGGLLLASTNNVTLQSTILADNVPADLDGGTTIGGSNNLIKIVGPNSAMLPPGTKTLDPNLGPLAINGGATRTHLLGAGSPAIDAGSNVANLTLDQRGGNFARVVGAAPDIGASEFDPDRIFVDRFDAL